MSTKEKTNTAPSPSPTLPPPPSASPGPTDTNKSDAATTTAVASASAVDDEACDVIQGFAELMEDDLVPEKDVTAIETLTSIALESSKYADVISDLVITRLKSMPPDQRILAFYLIDSIVNSEQSDTSGKKSSYKSIFGNLIGGLFMETYLKLPQVPELRNLFARLLDAWTKSERFEKSVLNSLNARFVSVRSLEMTALPRPSQTFYRVQQQQPVAPSAPYYPQQNSGQPFYNSYNNYPGPYTRQPQAQQPIQPSPQWRLSQRPQPLPPQQRELCGPPPPPPPPPPPQQQQQQQQQPLHNVPPASSYNTQPQTRRPAPIQQETQRNTRKSVTTHKRVLVPSNPALHKCTVCGCKFERLFDKKDETWYFSDIAINEQANTFSHLSCVDTSSVLPGKTKLGSDEEENSYVAQKRPKLT